MLLNFNDTAKRLAVRTDVLSRMVQAGDVPAPRIVGGLARFIEAELAEWVAAGCPKCEVPTPREELAIRAAVVKEDLAEAEREEEIEKLQNERGI